MNWTRLVDVILVSGGLFGAALGCAGSGSATRGGKQPEPSYQTPPLPAWSPTAAPQSTDAAALEGEGVGAQAGPPELGGEWVSETPQKPAESEKSVDSPPEEGQNSSTAPSDHGTVAPPQSD